MYRFLTRANHSCFKDIIAKTNINVGNAFQTCVYNTDIQSQLII